MENRIILYTKNNCPQCKMTKKFLADKNVSFTERNIDKEPEYIKRLKEQGYTTVPIVVTQDVSILGFNPKELKELANTAATEISLFHTELDLKDHEEIISCAKEKAYKKACFFEKAFYENIFQDKDKIIFESEDFPKKSYNTYKELFEDNYRLSFLSDFENMALNDIIDGIGADELKILTKNDSQIDELFHNSKKELDLDNDGVPDRIDIDDTRNSVQTVADLNSQKNAPGKNNGNYLER